MSTIVGNCTKAHKKSSIKMEDILTLKTTNMKKVKKFNIIYENISAIVCEV